MIRAVFLFVLGLGLLLSGLAMARWYWSAGAVLALITGGLACIVWADALWLRWYAKYGKYHPNREYD